jgi:hypothetical protein
MSGTSLSQAINMAVLGNNLDEGIANCGDVLGRTVDSPLQGRKVLAQIV